MKKLFFLVIITFSLHSFSQIIQGTVLDENSNPLVGVSIYLDGTTIETSTDENGKYFLNLKEQINTSLIIRLMGYETVYIANPFENRNLQIYLAPKEIKLSEVVIKKEPFTRKQKLIVFREQFLGTSKAGKSCIIANEDEISFDYDYNANILYATANSPIKVKNNYLGYEIEFDLHEFYVKFSQKSINNADVIKILFLGTTFYKEINKGEKINTKREGIYKGSQMNFFKNLSENNWGKDEFIFFNGEKQDNPENYFTITTNGSTKKIELTNNQADKVLLSEKVKFYAAYNLLYNKREQSKVIFLIDTFYVDEFGNISNPAEIEFSGSIGKNRLGDMLPMNYSMQLNN